MAKVGFLGAATLSVWQPWTLAFARRLHELGWIEGRTVTILYRWAEGRTDRYTEIAAEFARLKVDVIVAVGSAVPIVRRITPSTPIVFALATDPVRGGLVASLSRPGGNVTGFSNQGADLGAKRLELLREVHPRLRRLAILVNAGFPEQLVEMREAQDAARALGIQVVVAEVRRAEEIAPALEALRGRVDALYVVIDAVVATNHARISRLALAARLPTIYSERTYAVAGGLMSYGPHFPDLFRRAAEYVDKILRGAKPAELPVMQPTKFDLVINMVTAKALGLSIPQTLLTRADEIIE